MKKKFNLLSIYVIINVLFIFICSLRYIDLKVDYSIFGKSLIYGLILNIVISIILIIIKIRDKKYKFKIYDLLLILIIIFSIISCVFSINRAVALFGFKGRYEGLFSILYYLSVFYLSSFVDRDKKKSIINVIIFTGVFQSIYALLQIRESSLVTVSKNLGTVWANGLTTNPNFFGSYVLMCLSYSLGLLCMGNTKKSNIIYGITTIILLVGLLISNTTSCAVGFILVFIYLIGYLLLKKNFEKVLVLLIISIFTGVTVYNFNDTTLFKDIVKTKNEAMEMAKGKVNENFGTKRIKVWKATMKIIPKHIIHGAGIDNYFYAFDDGPLIIGRYYYDKAHNEYLNLLVCEGIFSLISYLLLYLIICLKGIAHTYKNNNVYLLLPVGGYLIQAFFNIRVIEVAPIFFIALGLLVDREENISIYKTYFKRLLDIVFSFVLIVLLLPLFIIISLFIKLIDRDKVLYIQERTGRNGKVFKIYKFRTMSNKHINKFGSVLRKTSLDEIPQLINILKGDMSFIGPRPWIIDYYKLFDKKQKRRVEVVPGITGLAQVNGRNSINIFKKIEYDLEYVDNYSFILDLKILLKSIKVIFSSENIDIDKTIKKELNDLKKKKTK